MVTGRPRPRYAGSVSEASRGRPQGGALNCLPCTGSLFPQQVSRAVYPLFEAVLKGGIFLSAVDVLGDGRANHLRDGFGLHARNGVQGVGLIGGQANGHGFGGLHSRYVPPRYPHCQAPSYHGIKVARNWRAPMNDQHTERTANPGHGNEQKFQIQIDRNHFTVTQEKMTGAEIRQVPTPPIGPDRDLFLVVPGGSDRKIADNEVVEIRNGLRFFTAPAQINPGRL
jgi:hypothetical protein